MNIVFCAALSCTLVFQCHAKTNWVAMAAGDASGVIDVSGDSRGNCYSVGTFNGTMTFGKDVLTSAGGVDIFVAKLGRDGNVLWTISGGSSADDSVHRVTSTPAGNFFLTCQLGPSGRLDGKEMGEGTFLVRVSKRGDVTWFRPLSNAWPDTLYLSKDRRAWVASSLAQHIALSATDEKGNQSVLVTEAADFPPPRHLSGAADAFYLGASQSRLQSVTKLTDTGAISWVTPLYVGQDFQQMVGMNLIENGSIVISGNCNYPQGGYPSSSYFFIQCSSTGSLTGLHVSGEYKGVQQVNGVAVDRSGRSYAVGYFIRSRAGATPYHNGTFISGPSLGYVFDEPWPSFGYFSKFLTSIHVDAKYHAYVAGAADGGFTLANFNLGTTTLLNAGGKAFVMKLNDAAR